MATLLERKRFWGDTGSDSAVFSETEVDEIFVEAGETHAGLSAVAQTRIIGIRRLLASSAKLTSYRQNNSQENASDVFKHLKELLKFWQDELDDAEGAASTSGAARFGGQRRKPKRVTERPGA